MVEIKKAIGKMGHLARSGAKKAGSMVKDSAKETFTKENAPKAYNVVKEKAGNVVHEADEVRDRAVDYSERVNKNTKSSSLFDMGHQRSESLLFGGGLERREHRSGKHTSYGIFGSSSSEPKERKPHKRNGTTIVVHVNQGQGKSRRRKKRRSHLSHSILF
jgi:hypothetical protein